MRRRRLNNDSEHRSAFVPVEIAATEKLLAEPELSDAMVKTRK